tara:strand:+ start:117 stop:419 length:303 start_codon:yes stop_codon:yes gene_type:complete
MEPKEVIDILEEDGILLCRIQVPPRNYAFSKTLVYRTEKVVEMLIRKGFQIDQILEESFVHNKTDSSSRYEGTWKFKLAEPKKVSAKSRKPRTTVKKTKG